MLTFLTNELHLSFFLSLSLPLSFFLSPNGLYSDTDVCIRGMVTYNQTEYTANRVESLLGYNKGYFLGIYCSIFQNIFNYYITRFPLGEFRWCDFYLYSVDA